MCESEICYWCKEEVTVKPDDNSGYYPLFGKTVPLCINCFATLAGVLI